MADDVPRIALPLNGFEEHVYEPGARPPAHEPTYRVPLLSVDDARAELGKFVRRAVENILSYSPPPDRVRFLDLNDYRPPSFGIIGPPGIGKTTLIAEYIVPTLLEAGLTPVISSPTHKLNGQTNSLLKSIGIDAGSYYGREADGELSLLHNRR
jgi:hypothetical protein